ncbi:hypothetical protein ABH930_002072 [Kitasatospora sp. GAS204A]|uniref:hypothetical protein n=1 Tax=unclassified Kitasatospora TaxID=2633591 RepID=UPI002475D2B1|nr:hypothetical protein [Kitasatospora sp. GAS204B]MDH6116065.1 hypothetical protein [Kitasatospora sp. GAS204B]
MSDLDQLVPLDLRELVDRLAARDPAVSELGTGQWRAVVELLTIRLTDGCANLRPDFWASCSAAFGYALDAAVAAGEMEHGETVVRRLNLTAALLRRVPEDPDVDLLDAHRVVEVFLRETPVSIAEAQEAVVDWHTRDIAALRRLRAAKNLLVPTLAILHAVGGCEGDERLTAWAAVLPTLP